MDNLTINNIKSNVSHIRESNKAGLGFTNAMILNGKKTNDDNFDVPPITNIHMYRSILSNIYITLTSWVDKSETIENEELKIIERILLRRGWCVLLKPKLQINNKIVTLNKYRIFEANSVLFNQRLLRPHKINIINLPEYDNDEFYQFQITYDKEDFHIISCFNDLSPMNVPYIRVIHDYAERLNEIDLAINAHIAKLRLPIIAPFENEKSKNNLMAIAETSINNGIFSYVHESNINGKNGKINTSNKKDYPFIEFKIEYILDKLYKEKNDLIDEFGRLLGINTNPHNKSTYVSEAVQFASLGFNVVRREQGILFREEWAKELNKKTGLQLEVQSLDKKINITNNDTNIEE